MRIFLLLLISISLYSTGFWTLSGLEKARFFVKDNTDSLDAKTKKIIRSKMSSMLVKNNIATDKQDSPTLILFIDKITNHKNNYVYLQLALGEEVKTFRKTKDETFSLTYNAYDFIEVNNAELEYEILESTDFLLSQFSELYIEDN